MAPRQLRGTRTRPGSGRDTPGERSTRPFVVLAAAALVTVLAGCGQIGPSAEPSGTATAASLPGGASSSGVAASATGPSGGTTSPDASAIQHVFLVVLENTYYSTAFGKPYTHALATQNAYATRYYAPGHPSLGNYLRITGGTGGETSGDCSPGSSCHVSTPNLVDRLEAKGLTWKAYLQSMGAPCRKTDAGAYVVHHDPFVYFDSIRGDAARCAAHVVDYGNLAADLATTATTPSFAFLGPDDDNSSSGADAWLKDQLPAVLGSPACTQQRCLVVVTWDEDDYHHDNRVLTIFAGSAARGGGFASGAAYTHYSLLRTMEDVFGVSPLNENDGSASPMSDMLR